MPAVDNMKISIFPFSHMIRAMERLAVVICFWCNSTYRGALEILHIQAKIAKGFFSDDYDKDGDVDDHGCVEHCSHQRQPAHRLAVIEIGNCLSNAFVFRLCASDFGNLAIMAILAILMKSSISFQNFLLCFSVIWFRNHWKKKYSGFHIQLWKRNKPFFFTLLSQNDRILGVKVFFSSKKWHRPWCLGKTSAIFSILISNWYQY